MKSVEVVEGPILVAQDVWRVAELSETVANYKKGDTRRREIPSWSRGACSTVPGRRRTARSAPRWTWSPTTSSSSSVAATSSVS